MDPIQTLIAAIGDGSADLGEVLATLEATFTVPADASIAPETAGARLVLIDRDGTFVLYGDGEEIGSFATEEDALAAVTQFATLAPIQPDTAQGKPFNAFITPEGVESGDGRLWELDTVTWREPPLALMFQDTASHGPGEPAPAWFAGSIEQVFRDPTDPSRIMGRGHLMPGADGARAEAMIRAGMRGVSIDGVGARNGSPPVTQITQVDQEGTPLEALIRYSDVRIMGATAVPHPAFEPCCIWFDDEPVPDRVMQTHGQQIPMDAPPEIVNTEIAALVASGGGPAKPPKAWFHVEPPNAYQQVRVTPEGQISGHIGPTGTCHIGIAGKCETIPASSANYRYFHRTVAATAEGEEVRCGWLTMNTGHESTARGTTAASAMAHYDNTGTQVAKVRVVDTPHGPWMCGAVAPDLDEQTLWKLQGPDVSGDWRDIDGFYRELVACLAVPLPGFMPRPEALVASGRIVAQVGTLPCDDGCDGGPTEFMREYEALAKGTFVLAPHDAAVLKALRPTALAAIREKVSPEPMLEAARAAAAPHPAAAWRERLRV